MIGPADFNQVNTKQLQEVEAQLNKLQDSAYREDWKCGIGGDYFWRISGQGHMNSTTFIEVERQALSAGWSYLELINGEDRYDYYCIKFHTKE